MDRRLAAAPSPTGPRNPAVRRDHAGADGRRTAGQPPGPAALDDDLVQSGSRLCAAAVDDIRAIERETNLPASIVSGFQGAAQVFQDSLKGRGVVVLAAVFASPNRPGKSGGGSPTGIRPNRPRETATP